MRSIIPALCALISEAAFSRHPASVDCFDMKHVNTSYTVCRVDLAKEHLQIFYRDASGAPLRNFENTKKSLLGQGRELMFAMNGGMFNEDLSPVGLLVDQGLQVNEINLFGWPESPQKPRGRTGNFHVIPNGVFWTKDGKAYISNSMTYSKAAHKPDIAIQSGPLLLEAGRIPNSLNNYNNPGHLRNGVCVSKPNEAVFVISNQGVGIKSFASFMREGLGCADALYFDGCRSVLFIKQSRENDRSCPSKDNPKGFPLGAMIGVSRQISRQER